MQISKMTCLIAIFMMALLLFIYAKTAVAAETLQEKSETNIPLYIGLRFIDHITLKSNITADRYCSNSPPATILNFYKNIFKKALEVQEGSPKGMVYKLLLDVNSLLNWQASRRFIEVYTDRQRTGCTTIVHIAEISKPSKDAEQTPSTTKEDKVSTAVSEPTLRQKPAEEVPSGRKYIGVGVFTNTLNFSAGPTLILWPFENLAIQGYYGIGTFTSYEARMFYRFNISSTLNPYLGAGYLHAEKEATVIGVNTKIEGNSFNILGGIELPIYKGLFAYIEASATSMKLEKDVTNGTRSAKAKVKYSPATIGAGLVFYFW